MRHILFWVFVGLSVRVLTPYVTFALHQFFP